MTNTDSDQATEERSGSDAKSTTRRRPPAPARAAVDFAIDDNREKILNRTKAFENPHLAEAIGKLSRLRGEGSPASFLDIRTPSGKLDRIFTKAVETALGNYIEMLPCDMDTPAELEESIRRWVYENRLADELNRVAQLASRRQSSEARQHILARFHAALIHDLLRSDDDDGYKADPEDAPGFLEAELFEMEKDGGPLDLVAAALVDIVATENRRLLTENERLLAIREMRRAL